MGSKYSHLTLEERRKIERWRQAKVSPCRMAKILGRHRSTIFRELKRNHFQDEQLPDIVGYFAVAAHQECATRRSRKRKLIKHSDLRHLVTDRIKDGWTPEQIAGRMRYEGASHRVCQETIYRNLFEDRPGPGAVVVLADTSKVSKAQTSEKAPATQIPS